MKENGFVVSALKYRPAEWEEVVGQSGITSTLKNAIAQEEIAKAYLFCGPRGVGKTTSARIFAKAINAKFIPEGSDLSFNVFELDAASNNSVDDIRQLIDQVRIQPQLGKYKVYIIDEVHMLSTQAFNAFLKTLEEPPPHAIFILATTEKHKVLPTILSRCQIYDFQRIQVKDMVEHLAKIATDQSVTFEEAALHLIASKADGALRDALSLFDQMVSFTGKHLDYKSVAANLNVLDHAYFSRLVESITRGEVGQCLLIHDEVLKKGFDSLMFMLGLSEYLRNLLVAKHPQTINLLDAPNEVKQLFLDQSQYLSEADIIAHLEVLQQAEVAYRASKNKRLLTEMSLMKLCKHHGLTAAGAEKKKLAPRAESAVSVKEDSSKPEAIAQEVAELEPPAAEEPEIQNTLSPKSPEEHEAAPVVPLTPYEEPDPMEPIRASQPSQDELILNAVKEPKAPSIQADTQPAKPQQAPAEPSETTLNATSQEVPEAAPKTVAAPLAKPSKPRRSRGISLSSLDEEEVEVKEGSTAEEAIQHEAKVIDRELLMSAWKAYAERMHQEKKYSFFSTLSNRDPIIVDDLHIKILLENEVQLEHLEVEKVTLMTYIRQELDHPGLILLSEIIEEETADNTAFKTERDRLTDMVKKNPVLKKLYEDFDLEIQ